MPNREDKDWPNSDSATHFTLWIILWMLIALLVTTFLFAFTYGDEETRTDEKLYKESIFLGAIPASGTGTKS